MGNNKSMFEGYESMMISDLFLMPQSKKEAIEDGEEYYFTGICLQGHLAVRKTADGRCLKCSSSYAAKSYAKNKDNIIKYTVEYNRNKYLNDPHFKAAKIARAQLKRVLDTANLKKTRKTFDILKYTAAEFKEDIESKFKEGMTWDNYGSDWHLDHIKPVSMFSTEDIKDPSLVNALSNLMPMYISDHKIKTIKDMIALRKSKQK